MNTCVRGGVTYELVRPSACGGCVAQGNEELCHDLPACGDLIWVKAKQPEAGLGSKRSTPAGLYKPAHGGYPDA